MSSWKPGIVSTELRAGGCSEVVLDAEVVAVDRDKGNALRSFQDLSTRPRGPVALHEVCSKVQRFRNSMFVGSF